MQQLQVLSPVSLRHNTDLHIATAPSRKVAKWKNVQTNWQALLNKLTDTHRTHETTEQYKTMSRTNRDVIKDVGGFVGGYLQDGLRRSGMVRHRSILTLDADHVPAGFDVWQTLTMFLPVASAYYTTHSHTPDKPRYRILIPLDRPVTSEEYTAIARKVADMVGIDFFDDTTYQPERLMYWPSTSKDGEYKFDFLDAPILSPDYILSLYVDWRDPSAWPVSSRQDAILVRSAEKQGHPHSKPGIIGTFCRQYDIHSAIETFLSDKYEPFGEGRYSYVNGSTAGGLVVYQDGLFAYSHHSSDPVGSELVNSYDLVRLHLFGALDDDAKAETPISRLPSSNEMRRWAKELTPIKQQILADRQQEAASAFAGIVPPSSLQAASEPIQAAEGQLVKQSVTDTPATVSHDDWIKGLKLDAEDNFEATRPNIMAILQNDPNLKGRFILDEFAQRAYVVKDTAWRKVEGKELYTDYDDAGLRNYLETIYGISHVQKTMDAMADTLMKNKVHPVREYLNGLSWDHTPRMETLLVDYLGAEDTELTRTVTRKTLVAAIARIYEPGCKMDYMLTLAGRQGLGKSSLFGRLGGEWFSDSLTTVTGKEAYEQLQGAWLVEMGELSASRKADIESTKHFLSKRVDRFRMAYGRHISEFPRQCIFIGTTNDSEFLRDQTGNRRYWVVPVGKQPSRKSWSDLTDDEVGQIWAEAIHYYRQGETLYLDERLENEMEEIRQGHSEQTHLSGMIIEHLNKKVPRDFSSYTIEQRLNFLNGSEFGHLADPIGDNELVERDKICALEIWIELLNGTIQNFTNNKAREINQTLESLKGWKRHDGNKQGRLRFGADIGLQKAFVKEVTATQ